MSATTPNWQALLSLYEKGASDIEIAKELGMTKAQFARTYESVSAFAEFVDRGRTLAEAYFNRVARDSIFSRDINTSMLQFILKNRLSWSDRVDVNSTKETDVDAEQAKKDLQRVMKELNKLDPALTARLAIEEVGNE